MALVYAWPPVGVLGAEWSEDAPLNVSRAWPSGRRLASSAGPRRRMAGLSVSALARGGHGSGYMEALKRLLDGGRNYVRLQSHRVNHRTPYPDNQRQFTPVEWEEGDADLNWLSGGRDLAWFTGTALFATREEPAFTLRVEGLPPGVTVAWPGEFVTVFRDGDAAESTVMVRAPARTTGSGVARIRTVTEAAWSGRIDIGSSETAVFAALGLPRATRPVSGDWTYDWSFAEVFEDEVTGGFEEVNPWR